MEKSDKSELEENKDIGFLLKIISDKLSKMANYFLRNNGVTFSQGRVLHFIYNQKNHEVTQKKIETYLKVSHPAVTGIISRLEEKGFVKSEISVNRRLTKIVQLTEKGIKNHEEAGFNKESHEKILSKKLTDYEKETLIKLLKKVYESLYEAENEQKN